MNFMFVFVILMCIQLGCSIIPPACWGQKRVCNGCDCHCVSALPRDLYGPNTIGNTIGYKHLYIHREGISPLAFSQIIDMCKARRDTNTWNHDFDGKYAW